jgi:hypothetical protein
MQRSSGLATVAVVVPLLVILAAALWFAVGAWTSVTGPPMPTAGYVAMILGIVFSLVVGCGLMALLFYSSRHGYDEPFQPDDDRERARTDGLPGVAGGAISSAPQVRISRSMIRKSLPRT